jgi:hypothetical protein
MILIPHDEDQVEEIVVDKDLEQKSQSQRIRSVLFILWKQNPEEMSWEEEYYRAKTERYIEWLKTKIEE